MPYVYLILSVFCMSTSSIFAAFYNQKTVDKKDASPLYSLIVLCTVCLGWWILFLADGFVFEPGVLLYSLGFGACYAICNFCTILALKSGPVAITSLFLQFSLILVTLWGFIFWNAQVTPLVIVGLLLVITSIFLCLYKGKEQKEQKGFSWKWLFFAVMTCVLNAGCTIIQRSQQAVYDGAHGNMLMAFAMILGLALGLFNYLRSNKSDSKTIVKSSWYFPVLKGAFNVLLNVCVMRLATSSLSSSMIYPVLAVGGLSITTLFSVLVFKERLKWWQWIGILVGAVAVALLSI
ncbi:MAG: EamA family transporter [Clostridia bacterium]|nr:EamA family transporter [Clostridia bacterium]